MTTQLHQLVAAVEHARTTLLNSLEGMSEADASRKSADGSWSVTENVEHLFLAEMSGVTKIWAGAANLRSGNVWSEPRPNSGKSIEEVVALTWKPKETAPPIATPHIGGPLAVWVSSFGSLRFVLADLEKELEGLNLEDIVFPHFLSGSLDGRQRLEFLRFHIERHHAQIERVRSSR
ncbi:MAG: DinB family protein [Gemmatimonadaceae bacterium]